MAVEYIEVGLCVRMWDHGVSQVVSKEEGPKRRSSDGRLRRPGILFPLASARSKSGGILWQKPPKNSRWRRECCSRIVVEEADAFFNIL